jgi:sugar lactone lactonase YvrE
MSQVERALKEARSIRTVRTTMPSLSVRKYSSLGLLLAGVASCARQGRPIALVDTAALKTPPSAAPRADAFTRVGATTGFDSPESAIYDSTQNVWFVSNIAGGATDKDHNGFISRLNGDGTLDSLHFIKSGVNGALLDGPKGLALHGDTIWVADIDVARAFDKRTGRPLANVDFGPMHALLLNAIAVGPDGRIYITDTAIRLVSGQPHHVAPDKIFVVGPGLKGTIAVQDSSMQGADGISWDATRNQFVIVGFTGKAITAWRPGESKVRRLTSGVGQFDGDEVLPDGRALVSSWADSSLFVLSGDSLTRVVAGGLPTPADLHVDLKAMRVAIPLSSQNEVLFYQMPRRLAAR